LHQNSDIMALRKYDKLRWLVDLVHSKGYISLPDIQSKWAKSSVNELNQSTLPRSTFNDMREEIRILWGIDITCDRASNMYHILNPELVKEVKTFDVHHPAAVAGQEDFKKESPLAPQRIRIDTIPEVAKDIRSYPLHPSQREVDNGSHGQYATFEYMFPPTLEFYMKIRSMGAEVELIKPQWLRDQLAADAELLYRTYVDGESLASEFSV